MAKVLILDQSKSMRNTLRERLEYEGFSTEAAEDEEAASNMCEKIPFDVILSDTGCKIPDKGVPFIVLSSEASIDSAVEAVRNGAQDYLTKPIDMNRLLQSIHRTVDNLARYMRTKSYEYNQEHPNNEVIVKDIKRMSGGAIEIDEVALNNLRSDYKQHFTARPQKGPQQRQQQRPQKNRNQQHGRNFSKNNGAHRNSSK